MSASNFTFEHRDVPGFPGYRVGNDGSVWTSLQQTGRSHFTPTNLWRILKPRPISKYGHLAVNLSGKTRLVAHLVLEAFVGPRPEGMECCHFPDRDPANNALSNLRWGTSKANKADMVPHGTSPVGERNGYVKLTEAIVRQIRAEYIPNQMGTIRLGRKYGVSETTIRKIVKRQLWQHVV